MNTKLEHVREWEEMIAENGYKLINVLGYGSFGCVIKAQYMVTKQQVAIKLRSDPFKSSYTAR